MVIPQNNFRSITNSTTWFSSGLAELGPAQTQLVVFNFEIYQHMFFSISFNFSTLLLNKQLERLVNNPEIKIWSYEQKLHLVNPYRISFDSDFLLDFLVSLTEDDFWASAWAETSLLNSLAWASLLWKIYEADQLHLFNSCNKLVLKILGRHIWQSNARTEAKNGKGLNW